MPLGQKPKYLITQSCITLYLFLIAISSHANTCGIDTNDLQQLPIGSIQSNCQNWCAPGGKLDSGCGQQTCYQQCARTYYNNLPSLTYEGSDCAEFDDGELEFIEGESICTKTNKNEISDHRSSMPFGKEIGGGEKDEETTPPPPTANLCQDAAERAQYCCQNPLACAQDKDVGPGVDTVHGAIAGGTIAAQVLGQMSGKTHEVCSATNKVSQISTAVNGIMAATCHWTVSKCQKACDGSDWSGASDASRSCDRLRRKANDYVAAALYDQVNAFVSRQCADMTKTSTAANAPQVKGATMRTCSDPSSPEYHTPQCVCMRPDAHLKKECVGYTGKANQANAGSTSPANFGDNEVGSDSMSSMDDESAYMQKPNFAGGEGEASKAAVGNKGGGGGTGSFSSGGGGAGSTSAASGEAGFKTNIEQGERGGSGYSVNKVGTRGGGGFSKNSARNKNNSGSGSGSGFNLKDFLPDGKGVKPRSIAAFMSNKGAPEIGGPHENIFERISKRFYKLCLEGQLYKCEIAPNKRR